MVYFIRRTTWLGCTQELSWIFRLFWIPQKFLLKSCYPPPPTKKNLHNFPTQKIPISKISNPKKSFDHPCHFKSGVPPPAPALGLRHLCSIFTETGPKSPFSFSCRHSFPKQLFTFCTSTRATWYYIVDIA